ncbi:hypothetical protein [Streptacidiphilus sp. PAMC 29251]
MQSSDQHLSSTPTPQVTTLAVLRGVDIPREPLRIVQPERRVIPAAPPVPLTARFHPDVYGPSDRYDAHHADLAFGAA